MTLSGTAISTTTAASSVTVGTTIANRNVKALIINNSCNQPISICFGQTEVLRMGQNSFVLDLSAGYMVIESNTVISAFKTGSTPTTGELSITAIT